MRARSLFFRFSMAAAVLILLALTLAGFGLRQIFNTEIERRVGAELSQIVKTVAAQVRIDPDGTLALDATLPDPRFDVPYSGIYWQAGTTDGRTVRSRSLWDFVLTVPQTDEDGQRHLATMQGPNRSTLLSVAQRVLVSSGTKEIPIWIIAALDKNDLLMPQQAFFRILVVSLVALGIILVAAMSFFIRLALRPFDELGQGLRAVHAGSSRALTGDFPSEVQPVVDDLNKLIAFQDAAVDRAVAQASDLAHGLKTPLAVLNATARQAGADGRKDIGSVIEEQTGLMQRHVDRVLARARAGIAAALGRQRIEIAPVAEKVVRAFKRLPDTRSLHWDCRIPRTATFPGEEADLLEMLGNLLDNARKWAKAEIRLVVTHDTNAVTLVVEDDGPGILAERRSEIARGRRWDETTPGSGFGLAITRDLAEGYRGVLRLDTSDLGGLRGSVTIPMSGQ